MIHACLDDFLPLSTCNLTWDKNLRGCSEGPQRYLPSPAGKYHLWFWSIKDRESKNELFLQWRSILCDEETDCDLNHGSCWVAQDRLLSIYHDVPTVNLKLLPTPSNLPVCRPPRPASLSRARLVSRNSPSSSSSARLRTSALISLVQLQNLKRFHCNAQRSRLNLTTLPKISSGDQRRARVLRPDMYNRMIDGTSLLLYQQEAHFD